MGVLKPRRFEAFPLGKETRIDLLFLSSGPQGMAPMSSQVTGSGVWQERGCGWLESESFCVIDPWSGKGRSPKLAAEGRAQPGNR